MDNWAPDVFDVRPVVGVAAALKSWPLSCEPVDEPDGGTFYTDWCDLEDGPEPVGMLGVPGCILELGDDEASTQTAAAYLQFQNAAHAAICADIQVAALSATFNESGGGTVQASDGGGLLVELAPGDILNAGAIARARWKVTGGKGLKFSSGGALTKLG